MRFIFWCLFGRQVFDRLAGQHIIEGSYKHPVCSYAETVAHFPDADIVELAPLLQQPMHEVRRLFIDKSCHPSQIGYIFLNNALCKGQEALPAYLDAVREVESDLIALAEEVATAMGGPLLITGLSVWLDTLVGYMGQSGMARVAEAGLVLAPLRRCWPASVDQILQRVLEQCNYLVVRRWT